MMRAFRLAYDGRPYHGFQRQPDVSTVEGTVLAGLRALELVAHDETIPTGYAAAGRTDAGVSAVAQTVAFECPDWCTPQALNGAFPDAIRVWASADVADDFHATHDASAREYTAFLPAPNAELDRAEAAAAALAGRHDFHNLTADDRGTVRELSIDVDRCDQFLVISVRSDGFPRQLVRRLATVLGDFASSESSMQTIERVLSEERLDGADGIPPAPAESLLLTAVEYPGVAFRVDERAAEAASQAIEDRLWTTKTRANVLEHTLDKLADSADR